LARIHFELSEADKKRFQKATRTLDVDMSDLLRTFVAQWLEEHRQLNGQVRGFLVIGLSDDLYFNAVDKAMHEEKDLGSLTREHLESWVKRK
jgi:hypothetical protein